MLYLVAGFLVMLGALAAIAAAPVIFVALLMVAKGLGLGFLLVLGVVIAALRWHRL
jgi:hypothetical protein